MQSGLGFQAMGDVNSPAIVFLHGGGVSGWMWEPVARRLADRFYCLMPDLPEFGRSREIKPLTIRGAAGLAADLIRAQVPGGRAAVVGVSEGAQIAVQILAENPGAVERAIISSALLRPLWFSGLLSEGFIRWSFRVSVPPYRNCDAWIRLNMKYSAGIPEIYFPQFKAEFQQLTEDGFTHVMLENQKFRQPAGLENCTSEVLVCVGRREYGAMQDSARDLLGVLPNSRGVRVDLGRKGSLAGEHNWPLTEPDLFARTAAAFLQGQALPDELTPLEK